MSFNMMTIILKQEGTANRMPGLVWFMTDFILKKILMPQGNFERW